jgi:hypothetical protein
LLQFKLEKSNGGEKALIFSSSSSSFCAGGPSLGTLLGEGEELDVVVLDA